MDNNGIGKEISGTVEKVFCRLSGREPPLFPPSIEPQSEKGKEKEAEECARKEQENMMDNSDSSTKKRKFDEMSTEEGTDEVASRSNAAAPASLEDSSRVAPPIAKS